MMSLLALCVISRSNDVRGSSLDRGIYPLVTKNGASPVDVLKSELALNLAMGNRLTQLS